MFKALLTTGLLAAALQTGAAQASTAQSAADLGLGVGLPATFANGSIVTDFDFGGVTGSISVVNDDAPGQPGQGRVFDTTLSNTLDSDLEGPFTDATGAIPGFVDFTNALIIQELGQTGNALPNDESAGGTIVFQFDNRVNLSGITFLDGEEGADVFVDGQRIGGFGAGIASDNEFTRVDFTGVFGIRELTVQLNGSGAIGALSVAPVPVPATLPLLVAGFGAMAMMKRRRKTA